ncbi:MAG: hypothetical protein ACRD20_19570 [Terriglobales bacterium]
MHPRTLNTNHPVRRSGKYVILFALLFAIRMFSPYAAAAQQHSNIAAANLSMTVGESITIIPPTQSVPLNYTAGATSTPPSTFQVTTLWQLSNAHTSLHINWWFADATSALNAGSSKIPASQVLSNVDGSAYSGCTSAPDILVPGAVAGSTCNVGLVIPLTAANYAAQQSDTIGVQLQGLSTSLPAGTYTGTLNIQAGTN